MTEDDLRQTFETTGHVQNVKTIKKVQSAMGLRPHDTTTGHFYRGHLKKHDGHTTARQKCRSPGVASKVPHNQHLSWSRRKMRLVRGKRVNLAD